MAEPEAVEPSKTVPAKAVDDQLINELVGRAQTEGQQLTGEGGLLQLLSERPVSARQPSMRSVRSLDAAQAAADGLEKVVVVTEDDVGGSAAPEQRPDTLDRIEVGRIAGQLDDGEPVMLCRVPT